MKHSHIINSSLGKACFALFVLLSSTQSYGYTTFFFSNFFKVFKTEQVDKPINVLESTKAIQSKWLESKNQYPKNHLRFRFSLKNFNRELSTIYFYQNLVFLKHRFETLLKIHFFSPKNLFLPIS